MERLSGDFNRGYTRAIQDIISVFEYIQEDLAYNNKRITNKIAIDLLNTILENRKYLRESYNGFIRWNSNNNSFEYFSGRE